MSESDDIDAIRAEKRKELEDQVQQGGDAAVDESVARPEEPVHVEGADHLERLTEDHDVVLVDFYADWCGPCKMVEPVVAALHEEGTAVVAKVDIDQHQALAQRENVRGVPTMLLYADGQPVERAVGAKDKASLETLINRHA